MRIISLTVFSIVERNFFESTPNFQQFRTDRVNSDIGCIFLEEIFGNRNGGVRVREKTSALSKWVQCTFGIKICHMRRLCYLDAATALEFQFNAPPANAKPYADYPIKNWLKCARNKLNLTICYNMFLDSLVYAYTVYGIYIPRYIYRYIPVYFFYILGIFCVTCTYTSWDPCVDNLIGVNSTFVSTCHFAI
jgi:hypothetical protein